MVMACWKAGQLVTMMVTAGGRLMPRPLPQGIDKVLAQREIIRWELGNHKGSNKSSGHKIPIS